GCAGDVATYCLAGDGTAGNDVAYHAPAGIDCGSFGATCDDDNFALPTCVGTEGSICGPLTNLACGEGLACDIGPDGIGVCAPACDPETYIATCDGDLVTACVNNVEATYDCAQDILGGTCDASGASAVCRSPEDGLCDDPAITAGTPFRC